MTHDEYLKEQFTSRSLSQSLRMWSGSRSMFTLGTCTDYQGDDDGGGGMAETGQHKLCQPGSLAVRK